MVKVVSVSADVGWVVIPYKATQILLLLAIKSASLTIFRVPPSSSEKYCFKMVRFILFGPFKVVF